MCVYFYTVVKRRCKYCLLVSAGVCLAVCCVGLNTAGGTGPLSSECSNVSVSSAPGGCLCVFVCVSESLRTSAEFLVMS